MNRYIHCITNYQNYYQKADSQQQDPKYTTEFLVTISLLTILADIYWAGLLTPEIILILFTEFHWIVGHINDKQSNNARQFPEDFAKFQ